MLLSKHGSIKIRKASLRKCNELDICMALRRCTLLDKLRALLYTQDISYFGYWTKDNIFVLSKDNPKAWYIHMYRYLPYTFVLVSAGIELIFLLVAGTVLCFGFRVRIMLIR